MKDEVKLKFSGFKSEEVAQRFYTYLVDGGLEDGLIDILSGGDVSVEGVGEIDNQNLVVTIESKEQSK